MSQILTRTGKRFDLLDPHAKTSLDAQETNNLCCVAAGDNAPSGSTTEVLIPHEKLREAAAPVATLFAQNCPPAQPAAGYTHPLSARSLPNVSDGQRLRTVEPAAHQKCNKLHQIKGIGQQVREINHGS